MDTVKLTTRCTTQVHAHADTRPPRDATRDRSVDHYVSDCAGSLRLPVQFSLMRRIHYAFSARDCWFLDRSTHRLRTKRHAGSKLITDELSNDFLIEVRLRGRGPCPESAADVGRRRSSRAAPACLCSQPSASPPHRLAAFSRVALFRARVVHLARSSTHESVFVLTKKAKKLEPASL
ncbi:hypothetical protein EVAR_69224_1 [Eumeta japonica]|uniref:Uncharacterized protein n=1 Tax=Eumeta variegata TaxID=151549 RepID=A0A4C1ZW74_EUMVA|nr:hypothetical protein EVAR_69224_1 [Eumeta japonica]